MFFHALRRSPPRHRPSPSWTGTLLLGFALVLPTAARGDDPPPVKQLMKLSLEELLNVEVTSVSRHPQKRLDAPAAIEVIDNEDITDSAATTLPEALRLATHLDVAQKNPHDWGISARGFNTALANKLLVQMDGRTLYSPLFSGVFWDAQDYLLKDIERIEVISGPGATLWGANAVNGVINITTKSAKDTLGLYTEATAGTELRDAFAVRYGTRLAPNVYFRAYAQTADRDNTVNVSGAPLADAWTMHRGGFRVDAEPGSDQTFTVQGDIYKGSEYVVTSGIQRISGGNLLGRWFRSWSPESDLTAQLYYDHTHLADPITNQFGTNQMLVDDLDTYDFDLQHRFPIGFLNEIVWGVGYRLTRDHAHNASNTAFLPARVDHQLFSAFAQDEISLGKSLVVTLGSKIEHNDYTGIEIEPSVKARWRLDPKQSVWAAISRAVRMPSRYDRDIFQPNPPPVVASGSKHFTSERLVAYEAGYRAILAEKATFSASVFYNDYGNLRSFGPAPGTRTPIMFGNNLEGETHGLETDIEYQVTANWRLRAGYDLLLEHLHVKPGYIDVFGGNFEVSDPEHQASLFSSWKLPHGFGFSVQARWIDALPLTSGKVPSYAEIDARIAWHPTENLELSIAGQNLLHAHHPEFGLATARREELQRGVYAKVSWQY